MIAKAKYGASNPLFVVLSIVVDATEMAHLLAVLRRSITIVNGVARNIWY